MVLKKLDVEAIDRRLIGLPGWSKKCTCNSILQRDFVFSDYLKSIGFVTEVANAAEDLNHHPEMIVGYAKVTLNLTTHDAGGITDKDFELALVSETIYSRLESK